MSSTHDDAPSEASEFEASERTAALPADPASAEAPVGHVVASTYQLSALLGVGSIGRSFRAQRNGEPGAVALKLVDAKLAAEPNFLRRLARDTDAASKLENRHIARTLAQGVDEVEGAYIARELVDGVDLMSAAKRAALTPRRICELLMQVLSGLSEAHRHGVLHRNLKPSNALVTLDAQGHERVVLCDFGNPLFARKAGSALPERPGRHAAYLAPEQADGGSIDGQADVYAVGVLLYELLTDELPFRGATASAMLAQHRHEPVQPPRERCPGRALPRELEAVCVKALAKVPSERHRSPREMSQALRAVVSLLGQRADQPLGSSAFVDGSGDNLAEPEGEGRMTMPGEQLRSRTKFWLGLALLAAVCVAVIMNPEIERESGAQRVPGTSEAARSNGAAALDRGNAALLAGETSSAIPELRNARRALGDTPEVLRSLGEALMLDEQRAEGAALLARYLELEPKASDREYVKTLIRREAQTHE